MRYTKMPGLLGWLGWRGRELCEILPASGSGAPRNKPGGEGKHSRCPRASAELQQQLFPITAPSLYALGYFTQRRRV